jgi:hypothetical protein
MKICSIIKKYLLKFFVLIYNLYFLKFNNSVPKALLKLIAIVGAGTIFAFYEFWKRTWLNLILAKVFLLIG